MLNAKSIARNVRASRLALNLTQKEMAERAGTSVSTYCRFEESGEIHLSNFLAVVRALGRQQDFAAFMRPGGENASLPEVMGLRSGRLRARQAAPKLSVEVAGSDGGDYEFRNAPAASVSHSVKRRRP